jgi:hypothetical protein
LQSESTNEAYLAAQNALSENEITNRHYLFARRYTSEAAARSVIGNGAIDLDEVAQEFKLGHQGDNYPIYDVSSHGEVSSVKTHWNPDGELDDNSKAAYLQDFSKMLGWNRELDALPRDGNNIIRAHEEARIPVPKELENASAEEAGIYLRDNSRLRIPDDHVGPIREELRQKIRQLPSNFFLADKPTDEQINHILERVQGIGITSIELEKMIASRFTRE